MAPSSSPTESPSSQKLDYLQAKYMFRYPFTIKSLKWSATLGIFMALHSYIKNRTVKAAFEAMVWTTTLAVFPIWGFFMTKYNFYEDSIEAYEREEMEKGVLADAFKTMMEVKLGLGPNHLYNEEEVMKLYEEYLRDVFHRNCRLDILLEGVTKHSFD